MKYRQVYRQREIGGEVGETYMGVQVPDGQRRRMTADEFETPQLLGADKKVFRLQILTSQSQGRTKGEGAASCFPVKELNRVLETSLQEWEVPRELEPLISANPRSSEKEISEDKHKLAVSSHSACWQLRRERQAIDAAIARHADTELLYDQPYEDNKRLRVPARSRWRTFRRIVSFRRTRTATARFPNRKPASITISPR